ncbi:phospholipid methyltransferase-domain-containing protein [Syncephalastrum racemosum]|uniref:Phosphatidyl-N-methylethanolamine N-methyltransferase n=1 Tax=Syncephalastrum racemosum TaxID=13706 RepID=A0A1X2H074_SYNRA|nr:phospholipid methyltransferase-domain-containing protein [Syncephalastrum racemosum]
MDAYIDFSQPTLYYALANILFNPLFWNTVARAEYNHRVLTKLAGGNAYRGCYILAVTIFSIGIIRDILYHNALDAQPTLAVLDTPLVKAAAAVFFATGSVLVLSSMWALGVTGTYLGDYFGILMEERVTGFPFNVCENPMYVGSTLNFLGTALYSASPAGLLLTAIVFVVYEIALTYEGPFTSMIYEKKAEKDAKKK